jgi:hypothetical protein
VHEDASKIQLYLESDVNIGAIDSRRPPQRKSTIRDLRQTGALCVGQLFAAMKGKQKATCEVQMSKVKASPLDNLQFHTFFKPRRLLPEKTFPSGEVGTLQNNNK